MSTPVQMSLEPSEEELMLREGVGGIAKRYGRAYMQQCRAAGRPPVELWDELGAQGYLGVNLPTEHGGGGFGMTGLAAVAEELSYKDPEALYRAVGEHHVAPGTQPRGSAARRARGRRRGRGHRSQRYPPDPDRAVGRVRRG